MKIKKSSLFSSLSTLFASLLACAVVLLSIHAKDLIISAPAAASPAGQQPRTETPVEKSLGELHHHVDKTMVKDPGMNKSFGDSSALAARREREEIEEDRPLSLKMIELMLMVKLAYAYAVS